MRISTLIASASAIVGPALVLAANPSPAGSTPPGTVTGFNIAADPRTYSGACPAKIGWKATIHVSNPPVQVEYRWERSDGAKSPTRKLTIAAKTAEVTETWQLGGSGAHLNVWEKVHVLTPVDKSSGSAPVKITCT